MEGTWGRRIYGRVEKLEERTKFTLVMDRREGKSIIVTQYARNEDLKGYPQLYKYICETLVMNIEIGLKNTKGTQP